MTDTAAVAPAKAGREAFVHAFELIAVISAAIAIVTAVLLVVVLRRVRPAPGSEAHLDLVTSNPALARGGGMD